MLRKPRKKDETPEGLRPYLDLGFTVTSISGSNAKGNCLLCGGEKLFVNVETGKFSCKSGDCGSEGNIYTFLTELVKEWQAEDGGDWDSLIRGRELPESRLRGSGICWAPSIDKWAIPIYGAKGNSVTTLMLYNPKTRNPKFKILSLKGLPHGLWGIEGLRQQGTVYIVEGHWDRLALQEMLGDSGIVVAVPGSLVFRQEWIALFKGRNVVLCYDHDAGGIKGRERTGGLLRGVARSLRMVVYPEGSAEGYDVRDFYREGGTLAAFKELIVPFAVTLDEEEPTEDVKTVWEIENRDPNETLLEWPLLSDGKRPTLDATLDVYRNNMRLTDDLADSLRVIYAVHISNQTGGDPLWIHIAGPAGSGKTKLLISCSNVGNTVFRSSITGAALISGFPDVKGKDPSLIPKLIGKTFVLKDFTEILALPAVTKEKIYGYLRGAYDGSVSDTFGNAVERHYTGYFSMVTGVTPRIFAENNSEVGERFLILHLQGSDGEDEMETMLAAMQGQGEGRVAEILADAAKGFLEHRIPLGMWPEGTIEQKTRVGHLARVIATLRATIKYDEKERDQILYRPEREVPTRLSIQLLKLWRSLSMQHDNVTGLIEADWRIVKRIATGTCIGWHLELIRLILTGKDGMTRRDIEEKSGIPQGTLYKHLTQLSTMHILRTEILPGKGSPARYHLSAELANDWRKAGLEIDSAEQISIRMKQRMSDRMGAERYEKLALTTQGKVLSSLQKAKLQASSVTVYRNKKLAIKPNGKSGK